MRGIINACVGLFIRGFYVFDYATFWFNIMYVFELIDHLPDIINLGYLKPSCEFLFVCILLALVYYNEREKYGVGQN